MSHNEIQKIVIYHDPCPDGYLSKVIFSLKNPDAIFIPYQHHNKEERVKYILSVLSDFKNSNVYFLDLCPDEELFEQIMILGLNLIVCDHHKNLCLKFMEFVKKQPIEIINKIKMYIDFNKSGCQLTWELINPGKSYPISVLHIGNKDIWDFSDPETEPFTLGYQYLKISLDSLIHLKKNTEEYKFIIKSGNNKIDSLKQEATHLILNIKDSDKYVEDNHSIVEIETGNYLVFKYLIEMLRDSSFDILRLKRHEDGFNVYSLRSLKENVNVDWLARKYGGNGHPKAAGYSLRL